MILQKCLRFWHWPREEKKLFMSSLGWFAYYFFLVYVLPQQKINRYLGKLTHSINSTIDEQVQSFAKQVRLAIHRVMRCVRLQNKCLIYALTAKKALAKKNICSTLYLGMRKQEGNWVAHAWLICGALDIVGCEEKEKYQVISIFE